MAKHFDKHDLRNARVGYGIRIPRLAANAAVTVLATDDHVELESTDANPKAVTMPTTGEIGQKVTFNLSLRSSTGTYTVACTRNVTAGNVTLDATGEGCIVQFDGTVWRLVTLLGGSTFA